MFDTPLEELKSEVQELGLRFQTELWHDENEADVYFGAEKICVLTYDDNEESWHVEKHAPFLCPREEVSEAIDSFLAEHLAKKKQRTFTVTIEYGADVPKPSPEAAEILAELVAKTIANLAPSRPKPRAVVVNGHRRTLRTAPARR